jgi:hypothetical protein
MLTSSDPSGSDPPRIVQVINRILADDWDDGDGPEKGDPPPTTEPGRNRSVTGPIAVRWVPPPPRATTRQIGKGKGRSVPKPEPETDCVDCYKCASPLGRLARCKCCADSFCPAPALRRHTGDFTDD